MGEEMSDTETTVSKSYHLVSSIKGILMRPDHEIDGIFDDEKGRPMPPGAIRAECYEMIKLGFEVIPGDGCDNHDETGHCRGHVEVLDNKLQNPELLPWSPAPS